ncbi:MAG: DUF3179 domain-containing protein [Verrucomicrobia bacterium]|nr:DUF3179 domain-containing protein [Verrucomicrobiota bacterium]
MNPLPCFRPSGKYADRVSSRAAVAVGLGLLIWAVVFAPVGWAADAGWLAKPGLFKALTEPPCSYCSTQDRKNIVRPDDRVVAWLRGAHNGGAAPLRLFLAGPRVLNDTYGLFFFDADGDYVSVFQKDYGYEFHGWRRGVMVVRGKDGTLWSALTGRGLEGPQEGKQLERVPATTMTWSHWLMLHPESTAYDLFDGKRYASAEIPTELSEGAKQTMGQVDSRLQPLAPVMGVWVGQHAKAFPLDISKARDCFTDTMGGQPMAVFWYGATRSAVAFSARLDGRTLTFYADDISPETAPFKDHETGTRWTLAGRGVDGPLKGRELTWINSVPCRWYAWAAENPRTEIFTPKPGSENKQ